jgi:hypothetical protein
LRTRSFHRACRCEDLFAAFDRAGAAAECEFVAADGHTENAHYGVFRFDFAADQLVRFRNSNRLGDAVQIRDFSGIDRSRIAGDADRGFLRAGHHVRAETQRFDALAHAAHIFRGRVRLHYDQH